MDRTSKNGFDLIGIAGGKLKGVWGKAFLGALMYVAPLVAVCAIPYAGWAIAIALFGWLTVGYIAFMQKLLKGENPSYGIIFTNTKEFAQATLIGVALCVGVLLGTVVFIVPGVLMIGYYSLSLFILNEKSVTGVSDAFYLTGKKMNGNKTSMFAYKVIYYLFYALVGLAFAIAFMFIAKLYETQTALAVCLGIIDVIVAIVLFSVITTYFYASNVVFYEEIVRNTEVEEYELKKPVEGETVAELNIKNATIVEATPVVEIKPEVKAEPKKSTAKSATTTAKKATATKPAQAKPAAKKTATKPAAKKTTTTKK